jgi:molybdenum cofactor cytidylyltransferase
MTARISAVILAAGKSQRMGQPKMLLPWGDTTVLGQVVKTFRTVEIIDIVIVTGGNREIVEAEVARLAKQFPVRPEFNPNYENGGMISSIQAGLKAISPECSALLIGLGDQPQMEEITLENIIDTFNQTEAGIIVPSYNKRRGHPFLVDSNHLVDILNSNPKFTLRDFLDTHQKDICYVDAGPSVLQDLDTPQDYQRSKRTF